MVCKISFSTFQGDHQDKVSTEDKCPSSCGRNTFFAMDLKICPRRASLYIYVQKILRLLQKSLLEADLWTDGIDAIFDEILAMCRRLPCSGFLQMVKDRGYIGEIYNQKINDPKKESFCAALKVGKDMFQENESCLLLYVCCSKDRTLFKHCVEMRYPKNCKVEEIEFMDNQSGKKLVLEDFPVSCLQKLQMMETKKLKNLQQDCGTILCENEVGEKKVKPSMKNILKNLSCKRKRRKRRATV